MKTTKNKHLTLENRLVIQEYLEYGYSFTAIGNVIHKDRSTIAKEIRNHRFEKRKGRKKQSDCSLLAKPPYVCNGCEHRKTCLKKQFAYDAHVAHNEYLQKLSQQRANLRITKEEIAEINEVISPLMIHKHHSVNHVFVSHPEILTMSKSTFYRYVDSGILNVRNIDLQRKVRFKVKKEITASKRTNIPQAKKLGRYYSDFLYALELNPMASIVEMDTVIGTQGGKGGKCFLTLLFRASNLMLIYLLPQKKAQYVNKVFNDLKAMLGEKEYARLFEIILTDNGTEFSNPDSIELSLKTGEKLVSVFYCDPNCSWQKGTIEKNHEYIRYVLPKGTSFAGLTQEDCYRLASHINSVPREKLNNLSPYEASEGFIGYNNLDIFHISRIEYDDIDLTIRLLKK